MKNILSLIYYILLASGFFTMTIPFIDLLGDSTLWAKQTNMNYLLDAAMLICGGVTAWVAEEKLKQL